ncbi:MAG: hypothetical protein MOGMAGMI_00677 [Candidatus Omnitrophica bacterium]|nr:hypothetical protein [Candidatus Omnitrophota bacterium]
MMLPQGLWISATAAAVLTAALSAPAAADTITDRSGRQWTGVIIDDGAQAYRLDLGFDIATIRKEDARSVHPSGPAEKAELIKRNAARRAESARLLARRDGGPRRVRAQVRDGHLFAPVRINGREPMTLLVDSGASLVVLSRSSARKLGIDTGSLTGRVEMRGAGNRVYQAAHTVLDSVSWDGVELRGVEAAVLLDDEMAEPLYRDGLLGQSFLSRYNYKVFPKSGTVELERARP